MSNGWNDFQKASKGQFGSSQEAAAVYNAWDQGTFPTKTASILYHFGKHESGRTLAGYTADAKAFWTREHALCDVGNMELCLGACVQEIKRGGQGGYYRMRWAQILTYWD